jgi:site-specific DNA-methyltransferase (adenine-specific)
MGMGDLGVFGTQTEFILYLHKGRRNINGNRDSNIVKCNRTDNNIHPTEKPVDLLEYLVSKITDEGDTVIDPFMGSGSCGVACKHINRNFIGVELDNDYYSDTKKRLDKTLTKNTTVEEW